MMRLLKWQAKILNQIYKTNAFQQIVLDHSNLEQINYQNVYNIAQKQKDILINSNLVKNKIFKIEQLIESANLVCHPKLQSLIIRSQIIKLNQIIQVVGHKPLIQTISTQKGQQQQYDKQTYCLEHVIIYSSLSKCRIWPKMLKCSISLVPSLIGFYNKFTKDFSLNLSYKFDPVILTHKYEKVMNKIVQKKKSFPQLFVALKNNDQKLLRNLIEGLNVREKGQNFINQCKTDNYNVGHFAAMHSTLDIVKILFYQYKVDFQKLDHQEQTAIFYVVKRNNFEILQFFVQEIKVDINHKQYQHRTPIYLAAFEGNLKIVDYLYQKGANPEMESKLSRTPLSKACYLGNVSVTEYLIKIGVSLTTIDSKGRTALHNAAWGIQGGRQGKKRGSIKLQDSPQCAQLLLQAGHPVDTEDFDGFTPLMSAAASLAIKSMKVLIKYGANLKHKTKNNQTLVFIASKYGHLQSLKILIDQFKCQYEQPDNHGISPLDAGFTNESMKVPCYLLDLNFSNNKNFNFSNLLKCLCYYKKQMNLNYLLDWSENNEQKRNYVFNSLKQQILKSDNFIQNLFQTEKDIIPFFVQLIAAQMQKIDHQVIQFIISKSIESYKNGYLQNFPQFLWTNKKMLQSKKIQIKNMNIDSHSKQEEIIKIFSMDTNLTENQISLYNSMRTLVQKRKTKVIIWILTLYENDLDLVKPLEKRGIFRYSKQEIQKIIQYETAQSPSIQNYCYIHGIHDVIKILQNLSEGELKVQIPKYEYSLTHSQTVVSGGSLFAVRQNFFNINYLLKQHLTDQQADFYVNTLQFYDKSVSTMIDQIQMIQNEKDLQNMKKFFINCKIIGIDIQHFSNNNQQFICLIQISGMGQTFLIDTLKVDRQHIKLFLEQIFHNQQQVKIFHSFDQDLKWISQDFQIQIFKSIVDTSKIYSLLNSKQNSPSLKFLAQTILSQLINKDFQRSDWRIRPLFKQMKRYAATDALLLPFIYLKQLMNATSQLSPSQDILFKEGLKKQFGIKRHIKSKGKKHFLKIIPN